MSGISFNLFKSAPTAPAAESDGNAAYTFLSKKGDPERNVYATQTARVVDEARVEAQRSLHRHRTFMSQLKGGKPVIARDPTAPRPTIDTSEIDYDTPYHAGVKALRKELKKEGMKFPAELSSLPYGAREALKNVRTSVYNLQRADPDATLKGTSFIKRKSSESYEKSLAIDKRILDHVQEKLTKDVKAFQFLFSTDGKDVVTPGQLSEIKSFFKQKFKISLDRKEASRFEAALQREQGTEARQQILANYRNALLKKIPWGRNLYDIAEAVAQERVSQTAMARRLRGDEATLVINGGSLFLEKGKEGDNFSFRLRQPYGQENFQPVGYELRFTLNKEANRYDMQLLRMSDEGQATPVPLSENPAQAREELDRYMNQTDLSRLFTDHTKLGRSGFEELYGEFKAQQTLMSQTRKALHRPLKEALKAEIGDKNITSLQMTGFSYNYGHYGENLAVNDRGIMMGLVHELAGEGQIAVVASCGGHQDLLYNVGGVHIGNIPDMLNKTYLPDPRHANDPFTVEEKESGAAIEAHTLSAAIYEKPAGANADAPTGMRSATLEKPIVPRRNFALNTSGGGDESTAATKSAIWTPREAAPLSLPLLSSIPLIDPKTGEPERDENGQPAMGVEIRPFTFHHNGRPVMASGNLKLASGIDANGNTVDLQGNDGLPAANELATWEKIELKHELPEGYCLKDDEGRDILDENGAPVRLLESITIVPQTGWTDEYKMEKGENGKPLPIWHDANGIRVYPAPRSSPPAFFDSEGNPAEGQVRLQREKKPVIQFGITGIERWVRVPLAVADNKDKAKLDDNERLLCTYEKRVQSVEEKNLDVSILQDPMYTRINCVHSQNGINTPWDQPASAVEKTGSAVKPNDTPGGRGHLLGVSLNNPTPHPIAAVPTQANESYINETALGVLGHGNSIISHQPHSDMLKEEGGMDKDGRPIAANPYSVGKLEDEIPAQYRGQRQGNAEGILTGIHLQNLRKTIAEIKVAGSTSLTKKPADQKAMLAYLDKIDLNSFLTEQEKALDALRGQAHPEGRALAAKIQDLLKAPGSENFTGTGPDTSQTDFNNAVTAYRRSLEQALTPNIDDGLRAILSSHLNSINEIGRFGDESDTQGRITDEASQQRIEKLVELLDVLKPNTLEIMLKAPDDCAQAMKSLRKLTDFLHVDSMTRKINILVAEAKKQVSDFGATGLGPADTIDKPRLQSLRERNDALYSRLRRNTSQSLQQATSEQLAYELLARQDSGPDELDRAQADKQALVAELEGRRARTDLMETDELNLINSVLATWRALSVQGNAGAKDPETSRLTANTGRVTQQLATIPEENQKALEELNQAIFTQEMIKTVFNGESIDNDQAKARAANALADAGLLTNLGDTRNAQIEAFKKLLNDREALDGLAKDVELANRQVAIESVMPHMAALIEMIQQYSADQKSEVPAGPQLRFRSLKNRGWELGTAVRATVGTSGPVNSTIGAILEAANNVSTGITQAFSALTSADSLLFGTTLLAAGIEGTKSAAYAKQRVDKTIPSYEKRKQELETLQSTLYESINAITAALQPLDPEPAQTTEDEAKVRAKAEDEAEVTAKAEDEAEVTAKAEDEAEVRAKDGDGAEAKADISINPKNLQNLAETIDARLKTMEEKLKILRQASHAQAFNLVTNPLLSLAATSGITTTALGLAGVATSATGPVGGSLLAAFGAAGAVRSTRELLKDRKITPEITKAGRGIDSNIRRRLNTALENRRAALKWNIASNSTLAAGGVMTAVGAGLLPTPAAPVGAILAGVGGALIFGGAAGSYLPPRREWRGTTTLAAEDTTLLRDGFLTTSFRRNRALHHLGAKSAMATELINKISDRALQKSDLKEGRQFRQTFKTTRNLRWLAPDIHRKELAKVIARHPDETKDTQFMFMYHTNIHELNWLQTYRDEQAIELQKITSALAELGKAVGKQGSGSADKPKVDELSKQLGAYASQLASDLDRVQMRLKACADLHQKLTAYDTELDRQFRPETKTQFDELRIRYMIVHDVVADAMSRKDAIAMVKAHEDLTDGSERMLTARIGDRTYAGQRAPNSNPKGKVSNVEFVYSDATVAFIKNWFEKGLSAKPDAQDQSARNVRSEGSEGSQESEGTKQGKQSPGRLEQAWAGMIAGNFSDKWNYEMQGVLHLEMETARRNAEAHVAAAGEKRPNAIEVNVSTETVQEKRISVESTAIRPRASSASNASIASSRRTGGAVAEARIRQSQALAGKTAGGSETVYA